MLCRRPRELHRYWHHCEDVAQNWKQSVKITIIEDQLQLFLTEELQQFFRVEIAVIIINRLFEIKPGNCSAVVVVGKTKEQFFQFIQTK